MLKSVGDKIKGVVLVNAVQEVKRRDRITAI